MDLKQNKSVFYENSSEDFTAVLVEAHRKKFVTDYTCTQLTYLHLQHLDVIVT
jgi:hypothetical protein